MVLHPPGSLALMLVAVLIFFFLALYISTLFDGIEMLHLQEITFQKQQSTLNFH